MTTTRGAGFGFFSSEGSATAGEAAGTDWAVCVEDSLCGAEPSIRIRRPTPGGGAAGDDSAPGRFAPIKSPRPRPRVGFATLPRALILGEQILEVALREVARKAIFAQHVRDGLRLALLQVPDFFLHGAGSDEPIGIHGRGLADAMRAVDGLGLDGRVPPRIVKHHVTGRGEVQSRSRGAQAEQKDRRLLFLLERLHDGLPFLR